jgi:hypothetical protein
MRRVILAAAVAMSAQSPAGADAISDGRIHTVTATELSMVETTVQARLLDPASGKVSDILAARDVEHEGLVWVCGKVQGKNSLGAYVQPTPFVGSLVTDRAGQTVFMLISLSGPSNEEQLRTVNVCLEKFN